MRPLRILAILLALAGVFIVADVPRMTKDDLSRRACEASEEIDRLTARPSPPRNCSGSVSPRPGYALLGAAVVLLLLDVRRKG